jgi:hypothetical protein
MRYDKSFFKTLCGRATDSGAFLRNRAEANGCKDIGEDISCMLREYLGNSPQHETIDRFLRQFLAERYPEEAAGRNLYIDSSFREEDEIYREAFVDRTVLWAVGNGFCEPTVYHVAGAICGRIKRACTVILEEEFPEPTVVTLRPFLPRGRPQLRLVTLS